MGRVILPRHVIFSVILLLALVSVYVFFEARRLQAELLRQTEAKGLALAHAIESTIRSAVLGNSLLEELISQRLLDNARLIDRLLRFPPVDQKFLEEIASANGLQKIELLDPRGQALETPLPTINPRRMEEMRARMRKFHGDVPFEQRRSMMTFMWGRRWGLPQMENPPPPKIAERKFWEGSVFGVAIGAESFPGIIAVHANAGYILNFRKEIAVQKRIEELGRQNDIEHIVLLDNKLNILAQSDSRMVQRRDNDPFLHKIQSSGELGRRVVERADGTKYFDVVKAVNLNGSTLGFLEIGLSLEPMEIAWRQSLNSMVVFGLGILLVGILGMGAIFYNQQTHLKRIKALEAEINRQERLSELGNLAATVAHEIRNPLNSVSMGLQRLKAEFSPADNSDEYARFLNLIQGEVQRLNSIVEQFLSLARPLSLKTEAIVLEKFLQELGTLVTGDARPAHVQIELKLEPRLPPLQADPNYLKQLLLNLILNGIQAMPEGGALTIEASAAKDHLELAVTDQGMGMTAETRSKIFEPYFTTKLNGSGLGLPIARKIIEAHGGTISVESAPGRGSRFRLRFPLNRSEV